ncbi:hypothetical protein TeGR_g3116 [Tetraparma gracilis]|uniref:Feruloyl esterase n=1 Tax=Tetraparma gracilis TaxID=2962635 RepID=A0ABQ6MV30_9STRA|nr:hypothetical protein TeGR_g3116 [Tetraparma gracilis]
MHLPTPPPLALALLALPALALSSSCSSYAPLPSGSFNVTIPVGSSNRTFELFTPWSEFECDGYCVGPPRDPRPVVINWHGCNAHVPVVAYQEQVSRVEQSAADYGWYAITPVGAREKGIDQFGWNTYGIKCGSVFEDDFDFFDKLLEYMENELCADMSRVYSTGFSTGGFHSNALGCSRASKLAGIAPVAGSIGKLYTSSCDEGEGLDVVSFHSEDDKTVPYNGNFEWHSQPEVTKLWEDRNGCDLLDIPRITHLSATTRCTQRSCANGTVEDCTLIGLDHCWPGGRSGGFETPGSCKPQRGDVDATAHMFAFWEERWQAKQSERA